MRFGVLACAALACVVAPSYGAQLRFTRNDELPVDFTGHKMIRMTPSTVEHASILRQLERDFEMDYWNPVLDQSSSPILTLVDPQRSEFLEALNRSQVGYEIITDNFQSLVDAEREKMDRARILEGANEEDRNKNFDYENRYHNYEEITAQLKWLAKHHKKLAIYKPLGKSFEGREIPALHITQGKSFFKSKKSVIMECGIHAREWISPAFCTWMANHLLTHKSAQYLLRKFQFIIVPSLNVDGFVYTHTDNRMWRKTRSRRGGSKCYGVDPNRNWDSHHCGAGTSSEPCSEIYCGPKPFSEPETRAMSDLVKVESKNKGVAAYFAVHSFSELWMWPYGYTNKLPPNHKQLEDLSKAAIRAVKEVHGGDWVQGSIANAIYPASGNSADWAYDKAGVKVAFALELRDKGKYGFLLPKEQIKPAVYETWAGVKAVLDRL